MCTYIVIILAQISQTSVQSSVHTVSVIRSLESPPLPSPVATSSTASSDKGCTKLSESCTNSVTLVFCNFL